MKKKIIIIFSLLFLSHSIFTAVIAKKETFRKKYDLQVTKRIYNNDYTWGDQTLAFNNLIAVKDGYLISGSQRSEQGVLIKLNQQLKQEWAISFGSEVKDLVKLNAKQLVIITAHKVIKLNNSGQEQWRKNYSGTFHDLVKLSADKFIIVGGKEEKGWLAQFSASGNLDWSRVYDTPSRGHFQVVTKTLAGDLIAAGEIRPQQRWAVDSKAWVLKLSSNGKKEWERIFTRPVGWDASFLAVAETASQEFVLGGTDGYIVKLDQDGKQIWSQVQPGFTVDYTGIETTATGELILVGQQSVGRSYGGGADDYPYLLVLDQQGNISQEKVFKQASEGGLKDIVKTEDNRYFAVGAAYGQSAVHNTKGLCIELNSKLANQAPLLEESRYSNGINEHQKQELSWAFDLLTVSEQILTEVELHHWSDYYGREELAPLSSSWKEKGVPVILMHGFQAKAVSKSDYQEVIKLVFGQLVKRIVQDQKIAANEIRIYGCTWPTKMYSIDQNAKSLKQAIANTDDLKFRDDIIIIAHSMGGILARSYIEQLGGVEQVQRLITIATPHQGVPPTLVYNWTKSNLAQATVNFLADNSFGINFPGLKDTFATERFYQLTNFDRQVVEDKIALNSFLTELNQNFATYYETGIYKLIGADAAGDENITFMYDLITDNYAGVQNDGLVATASALFDQHYSGIIKRGSHAAITEDEDVITAIIDDLNNLTYHLHLEQELLQSHQKVKVEIYKKNDQQKHKIYSEILTTNQWSTAMQEEKLTLQGKIKTPRIALSGANWVEIYAVGEQQEDLLTSFSINKPSK